MQLPYHADPLPLLQAIRPFGRPVLLHSADPGHADARYDLIAAGPLQVIESHGDRTLVRDASGTSTSRRAPLEVLQESNLALRGRLGAAAPDPEFPFQGGYLGLAGYDLGRKAHGLPPAPARGGLPDASFGFHAWVIVTDHAMRSTRIAVLPGFTIPEELPSRLARVADAPVVRSGIPTLTCEVSWNEYQAGFRAIQSRLRSGDIYQANLAVPFSGATDADPLSVYAEMVDRQPGPFSGFLETPHGALLSVSPERLLCISSDGAMRASPIKGTRPRGGDLETDEALRAELVASEKDRAENVMIVDLLRNDLGRSASTGSVTVPRLFEVQSFSNVHHLVSTVEAALRADVDSVDAFAAAFPGGSITGAPKRRAMEVLDEVEVRPRGSWCGSLLRLDPWGRLDASILIRTMTIAGGRATAWAGGGVVADSTARGEWAELHQKIAPLMRGPDVDQAQDESVSSMKPRSSS